MAQSRVPHSVLQRAIGPVSESSPFAHVSNLMPSESRSFVETITQVSQGLGHLIPASELQVQALIANTQAVTQNTSTHDSSSALATLGKVASGLTGGALSLSPLLSGLLHLFGNGTSNAAPPLVKFALPPPIAFQAGNAPGTQTSELDYSQSGIPRVVASAAPSTAQHITVQVQAMDSRSFMDHSHDIAAAVRAAMLNMHALNDVISDL